VPHKTIIPAQHAKVIKEQTGMSNVESYLKKDMTREIIIPNDERFLYLKN